MALLKNKLCFWAILVGLAHSGITPFLHAEAPLAESPATAGNYFECQIDPAVDSNFALALFRIWLPESKAPLKGVLAVLPGTDADGTPLANDPAWQAIAKKWNYALLGITFTTRPGSEPYYRAERGSGQAFLSALKQVSIASGHPELAAVPVAILGHSQGGQFAYHFTCWAPQRTIAFATIKGGYYDSEPADIAKTVPGLILTGEKDSAFRKENLWRIFALNQSRPGRWCYALEPGINHAVGRSLDLIVPFFDAVIQGELDPVIGDPIRLGLKSLDPESNPDTGAWLPNKKVADEWAAFMRGALNEASDSLRLLSPPLPGNATISPGSYDFGSFKDGQKPESKVFDVQRQQAGSKWDSIRAYSVKSLFDVSVAKNGDAWSVFAQPRADNGQPLGRLHDTIIVRFFRNGIPLLGGITLSATVRHVHDAIGLSAHNFYLGTHTSTICKKIRLTAAKGNLKVRETKLINGTAASLNIIIENENSATLEATFTPLPEEGRHTGTFSIWLDEPVRAEVIIPFMGYYKSSCRQN